MKKNLMLLIFGLFVFVLLSSIFVNYGSETSQGNFKRKRLISKFFQDEKDTIIKSQIDSQDLTDKNLSKDYITKNSNNLSKKKNKKNAFDDSKNQFKKESLNENPISFSDTALDVHNQNKFENKEEMEIKKEEENNEMDNQEYGEEEEKKNREEENEREKQAKEEEERKRREEENERENEKVEKAKKEKKKRKGKEEKKRREEEEKEKDSEIERKKDSEIEGEKDSEIEREKNSEIEREREKMEEENKIKRINKKMVDYKKQILKKRLFDLIEENRDLELDKRNWKEQRFFPPNWLTQKIIEIMSELSCLPLSNPYNTTSFPLPPIDCSDERIFTGEKREKEARVFFLSGFNFEMDVLEIKYHEFKGIFDFMILIESSRDHKGRKKKMWVKEFLDRLNLDEQEKEKFICLIQDDSDVLPIVDENLADPSNWSFTIEIEMRNCLMEKLKKMENYFKFDENDLFVFGDFDEFPDRNMLMVFFSFFFFTKLFLMIFSLLII